MNQIVNENIQIQVSRILENVPKFVHSNIAPPNIAHRQFQCLVCNEFITTQKLDSLISHIESLEHVQKRSTINKAVAKKNTFSCWTLWEDVTCDADGNWQQSSKKLRTRDKLYSQMINKITPLRDIPNLYAECVANKISRTLKKDGLRCLTCNSSHVFKSLFSLVAHLQTNGHKKRKTIKDPPNDHTIAECEIIVENFIYKPSHSEFHCLLCNSVTSSLRDCLDHVSKDDHANKLLDISKSPVKDMENYRLWLQRNHKSLSSKVNLSQIFAINKIKVSAQKDKYHCEPCKVRSIQWASIIPHICGSTHMNNMASKINNRINPNDGPMNTRACKTNLLKIPTQLLPTLPDFVEHCLQHRQDEVYCVACNVHITSPYSISDHTKSSRHSTKLQIHKGQLKGISMENGNIDSNGMIVSEQKVSDGKLFVSQAADKIVTTKKICKSIQPEYAIGSNSSVGGLDVRVDTEFFNPNIIESMQFTNSRNHSSTSSDPSLSPSSSTSISASYDPSTNVLTRCACLDIEDDTFCIPRGALSTSALSTLEHINTPQHIYEKDAYQVNPGKFELAHRFGISNENDRTNVIRPADNIEPSKTKSNSSEELCAELYPERIEKTEMSIKASIKDTTNIEHDESSSGYDSTSAVLKKSAAHQIGATSPSVACATSCSVGTETSAPSDHRMLEIPADMLSLISENLLVHKKKYILCVPCTAKLFNAETFLSHIQSKRHKSKFLKYQAQLREAEVGNSPNCNCIRTDITSNIADQLSSLQLDISRNDVNTSSGIASNKYTGNRHEQSTNIHISDIYEIDQEKLRTIKLSCQLCFPKSLNELYCLVCERSITNQLQIFYEHICSPPHTLYLAELEASDLRFSNYPEQFSDLGLLKDFLQEISDETIQCLACDTMVENVDSIISKHVMNNLHKKRRREWNKMSEEKILKHLIVKTQSSLDNIKSYWCQLCDFKSHSGPAFVKHVNEATPDSKSCREKMRSNERSIIYDSCVPCACLWLGSVGLYGYHCKENEHKQRVENYQKVARLTLPRMAVHLLKNAETGVDKLIKLSDQVSTTENCKVDTLLKNLEKIVKSVYPNAKAYPFGSRVSGLGFPDSDIDVFLDCGTYSKKNVSEKEELRILDKVQACLINDRKSWEIEEVLRRSRIPIIKLHHRLTDLRCDVSFKNGLSVENTKLIKCFVTNCPWARKLILFLKKWLVICRLSGSLYISNYAMCWYVIFYLQVKSIVPSVADLIRQGNKSKMVAGWKTGICDVFVVERHDSSFLQLLQGFFKFYGNFDFRHSVACPLIGYTIFKSHFEDISILPEEMEPYIEKFESGADDGEMFRIASPMCIQDPYDLSHNLTKAVKKSDLNIFQQYCQASAEVLNADSVVV